MSARAPSPRLWWVSWEEHDSPDDSRPLRDPPGPNVIAWWESGAAGDGSYVTMVALVVAYTEDGCETAIKADWPAMHGRQWRFRKPKDERPLVVGDRFPFSRWSIERLKALGIAHDVEVERGEG